MNRNLTNDCFCRVKIHTTWRGPIEVQSDGIGLPHQCRIVNRADTADLNPEDIIHTIRFIGVVMNELLFDAIAFAARAHQHQFRKDGVTPYVSHVFRVAMVASHVFGIEDPKVLAAAVLHDTIEDTATDYDNIAERFGCDIADWVANLTKEMHLPENEREQRYHTRLATAPWPVVIGKLADIYDNLNDTRHLPPAKQSRTIQRSREYLEQLKPALTPETQNSFRITVGKLEETERRIA